jgi:hypothetical protein
MNNLIKDKDYFVAESVTDNGGNGMTIDALKGMGMQFSLLFHQDGTIEAMQGFPMTGTWDENAITLTVEGGGETMVIILPFTLEGDVLKYEQEGETWTYRRSDEEPLVSGAAPGGGTVAEITITDGFATGRMSVVCPDGWYYHEQTLMEGVILFSNSPQPFDTDAASITVAYSIRECAKHTIEGDAVSATIDDKTWHSVTDKENMTVEMIACIGDSAVTVKRPEDLKDDALMQILSTVQIAWDKEQTSLAICEDKEEDFFKMRSMTTPEQRAANYALLKTLGYDWHILFRKDGTLQAKFDTAVTHKWGDDFENTVSGSWQNNTMTFTAGDKTGQLTFTLEGDIISITFDDNTIVTFRRSDNS